MRLSQLLESKALREWAFAIKNLAFPIFCKCCGIRIYTEESGLFCPACWEASPRIETPFCNCCGLPHEDGIGLGVRVNFPCADCREHPNDAVRRIFGAACYEGAVEVAIKLFKFQHKERLARPLGELMREFAEEHMECEAYDVAVPVPLHKIRLRDRGYNQSLLLTHEALPSFPNARLGQSLQRIRPTRTQSRLTGPERIQNVRGAFAVVGADLEGARVLLVDDVITTMGTVTECARALKRAGAVRVDAFAAALAATRLPSL